jgi:hypothetical protein
MRSSQSRLRELAESTEYQKDFEDLKKSILRRRAVPDTEIPPLKVIQPLLRKGRINDQLIMIPRAYSEFRHKYRLEHFFDPKRPYRGDFDPFNNSPFARFYGAEVLGFPDAVPDDGSTILISVDLTFPPKVLEKEFKGIVRRYKQKRQKRYSDDEVYEIRKLMQKGMTAMEIFRFKYPKFKGVKFTRDYITNPFRKLPQYDAWNGYKRILRLMDEAKTRLS